MPTIDTELYAYTLDAHERGNPDEYVEVDDLLGNDQGPDLVDLVDRHLPAGATWQGRYRGKTRRVDVASNDPAATDPRIRHGRMEVFTDGRNFNVRKPGQAPIHVGEDDESGRPLFWFLMAPAGGKHALLLMERADNFSIYSRFWEEELLTPLRTRFHDDLTWNLAQYNPTPIQERIAEEGIGLKEVTVQRIWKEKPGESDDPDSDPEVDEIGTLRQVFKPKRRFSKQALRRLFDTRDGLEALRMILPSEEHVLELTDGDPDARVKVRIELESGERTVAVGTGRHAQIAHPIDGLTAVPVDPSDVTSPAYPDVDEMLRRAAGLAQDIGGPWASEGSQHHG